MAGSNKNLLRKLRYFKKGRLSFSQCGEDLLVDNLFQALGQERIRYLDIGSHDPVKLSNTYYFYLKGGSGVLVEPDPTLYRKLRRVRDRDTCLNCAITPAATAGRQPFYLMRSSTLNTFSKEEAERCAALGEPLAGVIEVETRPVNDILREHFSQEPLHFMSIDIEGLDLAILQSLDFTRYRPQALCVETLSFETDRKQARKKSEILDFVVAQDYRVYADTHINTVFVDRRIWQGA